MMIDSELVRDQRTRRGWTQQQLAEVADLSLRTVQRVENQGVASNESVSALSAVLELPREALLVQPPKPGPQRAAAERRLVWLTALAATAGAGVGTVVTLLVVGV
ncbi:helix-turn-helix domain-containing protein [Wenzhouxiangella sp. XN79A]|uniref:helix-turn-helix domain-containing protein n=1 Tax=Wenzhouxiangella sp. XN79A TaxID=2724193 RepID=UPI00144AECB8|nr:helix-turn-helix domain-containing protein [Wenzhouxiangella sp. XN79A]NKI33972.1 helix-turn-helix domain-containing protein [Wenzhouxiangella sp. XN79A]